MTTLTLENHGRIEGHAGNGALGGGNPNTGSRDGAVGQAGGDALLVEVALKIDNLLGQIWAGAGGGGGGAGGVVAFGTFATLECNGGGGGGGCGKNFGSGMAGGSLIGVNQTSASPGSPGTAGTTEAGGVGGGGWNAGAQQGGPGGSGGGPGMNGYPGGAVVGAMAANGSPGAGGAAGNYVRNTSLVTWINIGDLRGGAV